MCCASAHNLWCVDPSALIFVALAVAWAAYLIPKALEHHDAGARSRTVDRFSHTMRVLARREPVGGRTTRLVRPGESLSEPADTADAPATAAADEPTEAVAAVESVVTVEVSAGNPPRTDDAGRPGISITDTGSWAMAQASVRRGAAATAARRRRRVLGAILLLTALVGSCAAGRVIHWAWIAAPLVLLAAWLVACRLMVRNERARRRPAARPARPARTDRTDRPTDQAQQPESAPREPVADADATAEVPVVTAELVEGGPAGSAGDTPTAATEAGWAPVPVTLPTYVSKPAAHRTVNTIDLDSTGVWTSGNTVADSALAREADAARAASQQQAPSAERRAAGS